MQLEVRHARAVVAIAEAGSISAGATVLALPQPALTAQLRRIERTLGGALFVRGRTGVVPTARGEVLIPMLAEVVQQVEAVLGEAAAPERRVVVLALADRCPPWLATVLRRALPELDVVLQTAVADRLLTGLREGEFDAVLLDGIAGAAPSPATGAVEVAAGTGQAVVDRFPARLLVRADDPLVGAEPVTGEQLAGRRWVRRSADAHWRGIEQRLAQRLGTQAAPVLHRALTCHEVRDWVSASPGAVALAPAWLAGQGTVGLALEAEVVVETTLFYRRRSLAGAGRRLAVALRQALPRRRSPPQVQRGDGLADDAPLPQPLVVRVGEVDAPVEA